MRKFWFVVVVLFGSVFLSGCILDDWKVKAGLQVITNDVPSGIYLDGKYLDTTPYINKEIKPGDYMLEIRPNDAGFASYQTKISLRKGLLTVVTWKPGTRAETSGGVMYEMEPLSGGKRSQLSLTSIPDGAIVRVDGQAKGFAPVLVEDISAGEHEYEVTLPSYETQKHTINVLEGYRMDVTVKLAKLQYAPTDQNSGATSATTSATTPAASISAVPVMSAPGASATSSAKVKILHTGYFVSGRELLRVRDSADPNGKEIGTAPVDGVYPYLNVTSNGWYKISFGPQIGWVSQHFSQLTQ